MKIGIVKEEKVPVDHRVPFTPNQVKTLKEQYPKHTFVVQSSNVRAFKDSEYADLGIEVVANVDDCDTIFGVKEVPISSLLNNKTYFFFSHTAKMQPYNKGLLQAVIDKNIILADYEYLALEGKRVVAFGRWAGIVGAYNGLRTYGLKYNRFNLKPANQCFDQNDMYSELDKLNLGNIKIALTGAGRVSKGAEEVLTKAGIKKVSVKDYLTESFNEAVYAQADINNYNKTIDGTDFNRKLFFSNPEKFKSDFPKFLPVTDVLIAGAYWDPNAPVLFTEKDIKKSDFKIRVIADITCDIKGSVPTTIRPSTVADPVYDINRNDCSEIDAYSGDDTISVMAVDNLPCELPRDASEDFGTQLLNNVVPHFLGDDALGVFSGASITNGSGLSEKYAYLKDWLKE